MPYEYEIENGKATIKRYTGSAAELTVPDRIEDCDVVKIGDRAFADCGSLRTVTLPEKVVYIGTGAFAGCDRLETVRMPKRLSMDPFGHEMFKGCASLKSITVPEGVRGLGADMFNGCASLKEVVIPDGVTMYASRVFNGCNALTDVTLPAGISIITGSTFENSSLAGCVDSIKACMSAHQPFVFKGGKNMSSAVKPRQLSPEEEAALAPEFPLGEGFILENEKRLLRRKTTYEKEGVHVFEDVLLGGQFTVVEIRRKNKIAESMKDDASLASWLVAVDGTIGLPTGRHPLGEIRQFNGISYGSCGYVENGMEKTASIVVCNGRALLVYGNVVALLNHLKPVEPTGAKENTSATDGGAAEKPSLMSRIKKLFGK